MDLSDPPTRALRSRKGSRKQSGVLKLFSRDFTAGLGEQMQDLTGLRESILAGNSARAVEETQKALSDGANPADIVSRGIGAIELALFRKIRVGAELRQVGCLRQSRLTNGIISIGLRAK